MFSLFNRQQNPPAPQNNQYYMQQSIQNQYAQGNQQRQYRQQQPQRGGRQNVNNPQQNQQTLNRQMLQTAMQKNNMPPSSLLQFTQQQAPQNSAPPSLPQNLPDGVRFEQLSQADLSVLGRGAAAAAGGAPQSPPPQGVPAQSVPSQGQTFPSEPQQAMMPSAPPPNIQPEPYAQPRVDVLPGLRHIIQNEHNAHRFYTGLAQKATRNEHRNYLNEIADERLENSKQFNGIYNTKAGSELEIREPELDADISFSDGVHLAVREENRMMKELGEWISIVDDDLLYKKLIAMICKKVYCLNVLQSMAMDNRR